jgi:multiple sugar transport system permease protein
MDSVSSATKSVRRPAASKRQGFLQKARKNALPYLLLSPTVILLVAFLAIPFFSLFFYSVHKTSLSGVSTFTGLGNFNILIHETRFIENIGATLRYLGGVLVISVPLAYFAAVLVSSNIRGVGVLRTIFLIPWVLAPVVTALLFKTMMDPVGGPITILLKWIFGRPVYLTLTADGARLVIILHSAWRSFPLEMLLIAAGITSIPVELYEAARVDGANLWRQFRYITLPLTRVQLFAAILLISVFTIQDAEGVYALTQGGPGYATETTGVRLFKEAFLYFNISLASSIGIALIVLSIIVMSIYLSVLGKGEAA